MERQDINSIALRWDRHQHRFEQCPFRDLSFAPMDYGTLLGAIVVERIRTYGGLLRECSAHWERMQQGCQALEIRLPLDKEGFGQALQQLLDANRPLQQSEPDLSIVVLATPGNPEFGLGNLTFAMHLLPIPWKRLRSWYERGTPLVSSPWATGAGTSWPANIKVRNRLAYYLADRRAGNQTIDGLGSIDGLGVVRTANGNVGDTSLANLLIINQEDQWISPIPESVLLGTSLQMCTSLLKREGASIAYRDVSFSELHAAKEIILVGNTPCAWHASMVDGHSIGDGNAGPKCRWLQQLWVQHLGFDWLSQGLRGC